MTQAATCPACGAERYVAGEQRPIAAIIADVAQLTRVSPANVRGPSTKREPVRARDAVVFAARHALGRSSPEIGRVLGNRDHSTILTAFSRAVALRETDPEFRRLTDRLVTLVRERIAQ